MADEPVVVEHEDAEAKAVSDFMKSKGIPIRFAEEDGLDEDSDSDEPGEEPAPEETKPSEEPTAEVNLPPEALDRLAKELADWSDPVKSGYQRREEKRQLKLEEENERLRDAFNDLVDSVKTGLVPQNGTAKPEPPEEEVDWFVDPQKGTQKEVNKALSPLHQKVQQLEQMVANLSGQLKVTTFRSDEERYADKNPDYLGALREYREGTYNDMLTLGLSAEDALGYIRNMDQGVLMLAEKANKPAYLVAHEMAKRGNAARKALAVPASPAPTNGNGTPPAPAAPVTNKLMQGGSRARQSNLLSAKAAAASPEASSLSGTGQAGRTSADQLLDGTFDKGALTSLLNDRKTKGDFFKIAQQMEQRIVDARRGQ